MFQQMLKNQRITFVSTVEDAEKHSPFFAKLNEKTGKYVVYIKGANKEDNSDGIKAAGLDKAEADACVMFCANEHIYRRVQNS